MPTKKRAKHKQKTDKFVGQKCALCDLSWRPGLKFVEHHILYHPEITVIICFKCHNWIHGRQVWRHPHIQNYGKDWGALHFFYKYVKLFEQACGAYWFILSEDKSGLNH